MIKNNQTVKLVYSDWSTNSNKEYNVNLIEKPDNRYIVKCTYGRRYRANNSTLKTDYPVTHNEAVKIFNRVVTQKIGKGYEIIDQLLVLYA